MSGKFKINCLKVSTILSFLLFFQFSFAQYDFTELSGKIDTYKKDLGNNVVVMIYKDGKMIYEKKTGEFDKKTLAPIASCSKCLTAALVMTYVDEGKLSLDTKVADYLPIFAKYGKKYITIRHCLSHQTGIEADKGLAGFFKRSRFASLEEEVNSFAAKEIQSNPGTEFRYSTIGLNIAARVLEVITKKKFDQLIAERILRPLGMRTTSFFNENGAVNPSGGARSTAAEYMNFLAMILDKGMFNGKRILSENAIAEMEKAQVTKDIIKYAPKAAEGFTYGLGEWILETDKDGKTTVVSSPGLFGTMPIVDHCRGYACIFFVKDLLSEQQKNMYMDMKASIDKSLNANCP